MRSILLCWNKFQTVKVFLEGIGLEQWQGQIGEGRPPHRGRILVGGGHGILRHMKLNQGLPHHTPKHGTTDKAPVMPPNHGLMHYNHAC